MKKHLVVCALVFCSLAVNAQSSNTGTTQAQYDSAQAASKARVMAYLHKKDSIFQRQKDQEDSARLVRVNKQKEAYRKECIKKFGLKNGNIIANGEIKLGFTEEMCDYAWGITDYTTLTTYTKDATLEKRVYKTGKILTFKKGVLISITE